MRWCRNLNRLQATSDDLTIRSPVNDDHTTFPAGEETVTFVGRPFDEAPQHSRSFGVGATHSVRRFRSFILTRSYLSYSKFFSSSPWRPSNTKTRTLLIHSSTRPACISNVAHIMTYTIHPTCAQYSRYPPMRPHGLRRTSPGRPVAPHRRVGHKNWGDVQAALAVVTSSSPPQLALVLQRWLTPLVESARRPAGSPRHPEGQIEESVSVHINDFANSEPVYRACVEGRKNLWVHRLIYEPETSRPRDLKRYEVLAGLNMKREIKKTR